MEQLKFPVNPVPVTPDFRKQSHPGYPQARTRWFFLWCTVLIAACVITFSSLAVAYPTGISGYSGKSGMTCTSCHSTGAAPTVTLTGPTTVASGSTNSYTLTNTGGGNGGLDVAASAGTFTAGTGTQV